MDKSCIRCGEVKPLAAFYRHTQMADGHLNKCKECAKIYAKSHRHESGAVREYDQRRYREDPARHAIVVKRAQQYRVRFPERYKAYTAVSNAIRDGRLKRQPCAVCGGRGHAHHEDYGRPLDVVWLCPAHHHQYHTVRRLLPAPG